MSFPLPIDEVAEDFSQALRDMGPLNSRYEISNLTVIAKENTEHALAISEALKNYIKQVGLMLSLLVSFAFILEYLVDTSFFLCML